MNDIIKHIESHTIIDDHELPHEIYYPKEIEQFQLDYEKIFKTLLRIMDCLEENNMNYHYGEQILEEIYNMPYEQIRELK